MDGPTPTGPTAQPPGPTALTNRTPYLEGPEFKSQPALWVDVLVAPLLKVWGMECGGLGVGWMSPPVGARWAQPWGERGQDRGGRRRVQVALPWTGHPYLGQGQGRPYLGQGQGHPYLGQGQHLEPKEVDHRSDEPLSPRGEPEWGARGREGKYICLTDSDWSHPTDPDPCHPIDLDSDPSHPQIRIHVTP